MDNRPGCCFQENGEALVMAGAFQSEFVHGVPKRGIWSNLQVHPMYNSLRDWEKRGLASEIEMHEAAAPGVKHVRMNCTIRWHDWHYELCPAIRGSKPAVAGEDQLSDPWAADERCCIFRSVWWHQFVEACWC